MIVGGALALAACSSTPDWLKSAPTLDTVRFESEPPNAEAKVSNGQTCRTPCALALPTETPLTVTYTLTGYLPETDNLEVVNDGGPRLRPNPSVVELTAAPPQPATRRPAAKKAATKRPATARPAQPAAAPAPAAAPMAPAQQQPAPWPAPPAQR